MAVMKEVPSFEDIKVQIVQSESAADLLVFVTKSKSEAKGKDEIWCFDNSFPDHKIRFVTASPKLKIFYVSMKSQEKWRHAHSLMKRLG
jgi:hypothetical protein